MARSMSVSVKSSNENTVPSANLGDVRDRVLDLLRDIPRTYQELINAGRQEEAMQLRDAQERLASLGSRAGVSSTERVSILNDMRNAMRTAGNVVEGKQHTDRLGRTESALRLLASLDEATFRQSTQEYGMNLREAETAAAENKDFKIVGSTKSMAGSPARRIGAPQGSPVTGGNRGRFVGPSKVKQIGRTSAQVAAATTPTSFINPFTTDERSRFFNPDQGFSTTAGGSGRGVSPVSPFAATTTEQSPVPAGGLSRDGSPVGAPGGGVQPGQLVTVHDAARRIKAAPGSSLATRSPVAFRTPGNQFASATTPGGGFGIFGGRKILSPVR